MEIDDFNQIDELKKQELLFNCCGSTTWVNQMLLFFPVKDLTYLVQKADEIWLECSEKDWLEAFSHHPKIGDRKLLKEKFAAAAAWASNEQAGINEASDELIEALAKGNEAYKAKFGFIFIVCATGKSAVEMLGLLNSRISNSLRKEIIIAAAEQQKITAIRLKKLFA